MSQIRREHISVYDAQDFTLMRQTAIYKAIHEKRMPSVRFVVKGKVQYALPTDGLMHWLDRKIESLEVKTSKFKHLQKRLRDYINGK